MNIMKRANQSVVEMEAEIEICSMWASHWEQLEGPDAGVALREEIVALQVKIDQINWDDYATDREKIPF